MFAQFSPDGSRVAYVRQNNLYVERPAARRPPYPRGAGRRPRHDCQRHVGLGERRGAGDPRRLPLESRRRAHRLLAVRHDRRRQHDAHQRHLALYPTTVTYAYPKPGTMNSAVRVGIVSVSGGATTWMKTPGDPRNTYLAGLEWVDPRRWACSSSIGSRTRTIPAGRRGDRIGAPRFRGYRGEIGRPHDLGRRAGPHHLDRSASRVPVAQRARRLAASLSGAPDWRRREALTTSPPT